MKFITNHHVSIPAFMYGTAWKEEATTSLVQTAVKLGFTAIDTANQPRHYQEALVGDALRVLARQGIPRESLFLQTKFTPVGGQDHRLPYDPASTLATQVETSFQSSLAHLQTDYLDAYLLHGPHSRTGLRDEDWEVWAALENLYRSGKTQCIGISNVTAAQLHHLCAGARVVPAIVQNRCYAVWGWDAEVREICRARGIVYQGFSLLTANPHVLGNRLTLALARKYQTGPEQIIFRFALHVGILPLTGTMNPQHMQADLAATGFALSTDEIRRLESLAG